MNAIDARYQGMLEDILAFGQTVQTRNSVCKRLTGLRARFRKTPLVSARQTAWKTAIREFEWFLSGSDNLNDAHPSVRPWWQPWAEPDGYMGESYATQFRDFAGHNGEVDQVAYLLMGVRDHPHSRRNVITTWNTSDMLDPECRLTTCHGTVIQAFVNADDTLDLFMYQRSADVIVGLAANWLQYWAFLLWLARHGGRKPGTFIWLGGDCHVYEAHLDLARRIVAADAREVVTPELVYRPSRDDTVFRADDFSLDGPYTPVLTERAEMVV